MILRILNTRRRRRTIALISVFLIVFSIVTNLWMVNSSEICIVSASTAPIGNVGLLLGTDEFHRDGSPNRHFLSRIEGASNLFFTGRISRIVVSGNSNNRGFNEPARMSELLIDRGISPAFIEIDYNGSRTFDSIYNFKNRKKDQGVTIISDCFHAPRVLFLCRRLDVRAVAVCVATPLADRWEMQSRVREFFARCRALFDVSLYLITYHGD